VVSASILATTGPESHFNPFGIAALGVGVLVLIILLVTIRRR
jgi:LPXTG-motif cell wall-anchored protein